MKIIKSLVATLIGTCLCVPALAQQGDFHRKLYIGGAGGVTKVEPEIRGGQNLEVTDDESEGGKVYICLLYTSPSPRDRQKSRMPSSA